MKRSGSVGLTLLAALAVSAHAQQRPDPCATSNFSESACRTAIQSRGYCWNGRWVRMKYRQPFPYYYDSYLEFVQGGGVVTDSQFGACGPSPSFFLWGVHGRRHGGFGATGSGHSAHA